MITHKSAEVKVQKGTKLTTTSLAYAAHRRLSTGW